MPQPRERTAPLIVLGLLLTWAITASVVGLSTFLASSRVIDVASHETTLRPTLSGRVLLHTGPILPDLSMPSGSPIGVELTLGNTEAQDVKQLVDRYAFIASNPQAQVSRVRAVVRDLATAAAWRGAVAGLVPLLLWWAVGRDARRAAAARVRRPAGLLAVLLAAALAAAALRPWGAERDGDVSRYADKDHNAWQPLASYLGGDQPLDLPESIPGDILVRGDLTTDQGRRLIESAIETYDQSKTWYDDVAAAARELQLHQAGDKETVAVLVSDRHDNVGMDKVARAIGDAAGATAILNAGDDTSTGNRWEAFSLDSLNEAFSDLDRWAIAGNHDHGGFVHDYLVDLGWTNPDGAVVAGPGGSVLYGLDDPRSSGLGKWRDPTAVSFADTEARVADEVCAAEPRVATVLVHDANLGRTALRRGCADLVVGGHVHVQSGPTQVVGDNGEVGYTYTNGTTGGAAYAVAVGSKPKRTAGVTLLTYAEVDGRVRPVGLQYVEVNTNGRLDVGEYVALDYQPLTEQEAQDAEAAAEESAAAEPQQISPDARDETP